MVGGSKFAEKYKRNEYHVETALKWPCKISGPKYVFKNILSVFSKLDFPQNSGCCKL